MKLSQALGLKSAETIAFVGAGGKTSAIATLAKELQPPVVITTSTHFGKWQSGIAEKHIILSESDKFEEKLLIGEKTTLITGPVDQTGQLTSLTPDIFTTLFQTCRKNGAYLLIEADGARQRPLKVPADYEPVIPPLVDMVVVVAGLDGLGRILNNDTVHRPELFSRITSLGLGDKINVVHLEHILRSRQGGLKGIPKGARRILFLNQAEGELRKSQGNRLANALVDVYDRVLVGSMEQPGKEGPVFSAHSKTAGVILAAGGSDRLGEPKQLLNWSGKPFVYQVAQTALTAGLDPVIVVTGAYRAEIESALVDLPVRFVFNPEWEIGQASSIKAGLNALPESCDRALFLLSDQPQISPLLVRQLIERHNTNRNPIIAPMMRVQAGNPVLFGRETFDSLQEVSGDKGGRAIFNNFKVDYLPWVDDRNLLDVDQKMDLHNLVEQFFGLGSE